VSNELLIRTELQHCVLRRWAAADQPQLVRIANNRSIWRNLTDLFPHPYTEADARFWIDHANAPSASLHLAIDVCGEAAGGIGIIAGEGIYQRTGQFGYWLGEPFWGRGIATAAARALVRYADDHLPFARLEAAVFAWNPVSMRVLEKAGFVREGILRDSVFKDGQLTDSILYAHVKS
jgi:RimJ/RimL family protein N-acetyltransferase